LRDATDRVVDADVGTDARLSSRDEWHAVLRRLLDVDLGSAVGELWEKVRVRTEAGAAPRRDGDTMPAG